MKAFFRQLLATLQALVRALELIAQGVNGGGTDELNRRVQALEVSRAIFEGEVQGALLKVDARANAARATEERIRAKSRTRARGYDDEEADFGPDAEAAASEALRAHAQRSAVAQLPALPESVAPDQRAAIRARKWGRT